MKISDEIRNWFSISHCGSGLLVSNSECDRLIALADRIDAEMVELPKDADGALIHVGETVYGGDGKAWRVHEVVLLAVTESERKFSVKAVCENGAKRGLRPEWLSHERPDSLKRIADELEAWCDDADVDGDACDVPRDIVERIRRLAEKEDEQCQ